METDHNLVPMKVRLKLKCPRQARRRIKWNCNALKDPEERKTFCDDVGDKIGIGEKNTFNGRWNSLKEAMLESARQKMGQEPRRAAKKPWVTEQILQMMEQRRKYKSVTLRWGAMNTDG